MSDCTLPSCPHYSWGARWLPPLAVEAGGSFLATVLQCFPHLALQQPVIPCPPYPFIHFFLAAKKKYHVGQACLQGFHSTCAMLLLHYGDPLLSLSLVM